MVKEGNLDEGAQEGNGQKELEGSICVDIVFA